tara:strand:+ start:279 stop:698 length:420 start_codon:yes stop_codon:yes gene_type:complete
MFKFTDLKMIDIFKQCEYEVSISDVILWLKKEEDPLQVEISDLELATFLNGLIIEKRGKREGPQPEAEVRLSNNMILQKMKIACDLKADDILDMCNAINKNIGKHELSAFFRKPDHRSYRPCMDQYLRNFFNALQLKLR